jgi:predicted permease
VLADLRYALRQLRRSPGFTLVAVLSLALGLGINTTIFSVVSGLLLRPLAVAEPGRLAALFTSDYSGPAYGASAHADYLDIRERSRSFEQLAAAFFEPVNLAVGDVSDVTLAEVVSGSFFGVVGRPAVQGRLLGPADDRAGAPPVVVLSEGLWRRRFGADPQLIGRIVTVGGQPFTVVGVAPEKFHGIMRGLRVDLWLPTAAYPVLRPGTDRLTSRGFRGSRLYGLLRPGVPLAAARAELATIAEGLTGAYPDAWSDVSGAGRRLTVVDEAGLRVEPQLRGGVLGGAALLLVLAGLVLLIACTNLTSLLLARAAARRREIAVRLSLGAGRGRLVRQLLTESLLLAGAGGVLAMIVALWGAELITRIPIPGPLPFALDFTPDLRVLAFALVVSVATGLLMGLAPALQASRPDLAAALRDDAHGPVRSRLRGAIVVAQVAMSLVLLVAAGLFVRSLRNAGSIDPGFSTRNALLVTLDLDLVGYEDGRGRAFYRELRERLAALPGVEAVSLTTSVPLAAFGGSRRSLAVRGHAPAPGEEMEFHVASVGPGYFETMGVPLVRGRGFTEQDRPGAPGAVVVNESFARRFWPGQDPIGMEVGLMGEDGPWSTVVGLARDGKYVSRGEEPKPFWYIPFEQEYRPAATLIVRTAGDPSALAGAARAAVRAIDAGVPVAELRTLRESLDGSLLPAKLAGLLLGAFGLLGLLLASIGLYGVVAFNVVQRTRELGIRMALGARASDVVALVVGYGARLLLVGLALGLVLALAFARFVRGFLYGLSPSDPVTYAGVALVLAAIALVASWLPARRAARVDPMIALREE